MDKFTTLTAVAAPLPRVNIDTDAIIPKQYLKTIARTGLGKGLFSEWRYRDDGSDNPDFVLNKPAYRNAKIIVAGDNFGCGSSREHAPWALKDHGIEMRHLHQLRRHLLYQLLPERPAAGDRLARGPGEADGRRLARRQRHVDDRPREAGDPRAGWRDGEIRDRRVSEALPLNGLDGIGLTEQKTPAIEAYEKRHQAERPWV